MGLHAGFGRRLLPVCFSSTTTSWVKRGLEQPAQAPPSPRKLPRARSPQLSITMRTARAQSPKWPLPWHSREPSWECVTKQQHSPPPLPRTSLPWARTDWEALLASPFSREVHVQTERLRGDSQEKHQEDTAGLPSCIFHCPTPPPPPCSPVLVKIIICASELLDLCLALYSESQNS